MAAASCCYSSPFKFQQNSFAKTLTHSSKPITRITQISLFNPNSKPFSIRAINSQKPKKTEKSQQHCFTKKEDGHLYCEGVKVEEVIMKRCQSWMPFLLYSKPQITRNIQAIKNALEGLNNSVIAYPVKANDNFTILQHIKNLGCGAVVSSSHEIRLAISSGFDPTKCIYSGTQKCMEDLILAAQEGLFININTEVDVDDIRSAARIAGKKVRVFLSIDPYIEPQVHPDWNTDSNFGISFSRLNSLLYMFDYSHELELVGVQCYLGSNITKVDILEKAEAGIMKFMHKIRLEGFDINYLNIGGDFGIDYHRMGTVPPTRDLVDTFWRVFISRNRINLIIEPGRSMIANTCCLLNHVKRVVTNGDRNFIVTDGSVAELLRPSLYDAYHHIELVSPPLDAVVSTFDVVSHEIYNKVCESADFLGKNRVLPTPAFGSWLVVHDAGAYGISMSSTFNIKMRPPEYWVNEDGSVARIRHKETFKNYNEG